MTEGGRLTPVSFLAGELASVFEFHKFKTGYEPAVVAIFFVFAYFVPLALILRTPGSQHISVPRYESPPGDSPGVAARLLERGKLPRSMASCRPTERGCYGRSPRGWGGSLPLLLRWPLLLLSLPLRRRCTSRWLGLGERRLRSEHLHECLIGALFVRISAAHADRTNELIVHHDR